jgi:phospholipid/cholesterol/gamma-HCH transport system substrate-binding protein
VPPAPAETAPPQTGLDGSGPVAAPSSFAPNGSGGGPSVAFATYDPQTGQYATPGGKVYRQSDLVTPAGSRTWKDLFVS